MSSTVAAANMAVHVKAVDLEPEASGVETPWPIGSRYEYSKHKSCSKRGQLQVQKIGLDCDKQGVPCV
jgi:hypothetical protein